MDQRSVMWCKRSEVQISFQSLVPLSQPCYFPSMLELCITGLMWRLILWMFLLNESVFRESSETLTATSHSNTTHTHEGRTEGGWSADLTNHTETSIQTHSLLQTIVCMPVELIVMVLSQSTHSQVTAGRFYLLAFSSTTLESSPAATIERSSSGIYAAKSVRDS